jgi:hypothetical protein
VDGFRRGHEVAGDAGCGGPLVAGGQGTAVLRELVALLDPLHLHLRRGRFRVGIPRTDHGRPEAGIVPGRLYDRLLVPAAWVGMETLRQRLVRSLRATLEAYGEAMSNEHLERSFAAMVHNGYLDFGNLPEDLQRQVIHRILAGEDADSVLVESRAETQPLRSWLRRTLKQTAPTAKPQDLAAYSPEAYSERLQQVYASVIEAKPETPEYVAKHKVLSRFLKPGSFHFLCT